MSEVKRYWHKPVKGFAELDPRFYDEEPGYVAWEDFDKQAQEIEQLRLIISNCAKSCGASVSVECSLDFMAHLPVEIAVVISSLREDRDSQQRVCIAAMTELEQLKSRQSGAVLPDDDYLSDLSASACQSALANGVGEYSFLALAKTVRDVCARLNSSAVSAGVSLSESRVDRVYIAGPMTGYDNYNFAAFNAEADRLRGQGFHVENPADHGVVDGADWADYLRYDIGRLASCERIHLLPGWSKSKGAALEVHIAQALGMHIWYAEGAEDVCAGEIDERAAFEDEFRKRGHLINRIDSGDIFCYDTTVMQSAWTGWKARAATAPSHSEQVRGKYAEVLNPFVAMMENELHANAGKGDRPGWLKMDRNTALLEIYYHLAKLQKAAEDDDLTGIIEYAADVANMSMMLVDVCGLLYVYPSPGKQQGGDV